MYIQMIIYNQKRGNRKEFIMSRMKDLAVEYAEMFCVINSLDPTNEKDWEQAMDFVTTNPFDYVKNYIEDLF